MKPIANFAPTVALTLGLGLVAMTAQGAATDSAPIAVTIDARQASESPINPHIYGQFLEHIGPIVNHGLWAEMVDDRKFHGPILDAEPPPPTDPRAVWRGRTRSWIRVGAADAVLLDTDNPYVGEHAALLRASGEQPVGVQQGGVALAEGKRYDGHIMIAGDPGVTVQVKVVDPASGAEHVTTVPKLSAEYAKHALSFTAKTSTNDARIEVTATGNGAARLGVMSLMPADNVEGFRAEAVRELKRINAGVYRFPGGNFVSAHEWRDAIGPRDKRAPKYDPVWKTMQPNDVGTDEFLALCRLLGADAYITASAGFGDAWSAAQLVEYVNGDASTPMGKLRAQNGHPEPYGVKLWGIGNEPWGDWQFGAMPVTQYVFKHNEFAKAMLAVDPSIVLVGGGALPKTMTTAKQAQRFGTSPIPEPLSPADWSGVLLKESHQYMDQLSEHFYAYAGTRFDLEKGEQVPMDPDTPLVEIMRKPANHVRLSVEQYEAYKEHIPALREKHIPLNIDEWALTGFPPNSYKVAPANAWTLHEMIRHSNVIHAAAYTFGTSLLSATRTQAQLNPAGQVFELYSQYFGRTPVKVSGDRPQPAPKYPVGGEQPSVNAGSDTFPLDVVAALSEDRKHLTIAVINPTESDQRMALNIKGAKASSGTLRRLAHPNLDYVATPGTPSEVKIAEERVSKLPREISVPRYSVSLYTLRVAR